ncbi:MAG: hypothetical protein ACRDP6_14780 [Actinoallomurus sp.]
MKKLARVTMAEDPDATITALQPDGFPAMVIARNGRWLCELVLTDGGLECGRWYVLGRARAVRKGRRELARYKATLEWETWTIT